MNRTIHRLGIAAATIAFFVIVLGAWVRLSHAGLGCPDWPGCYGQLTWPSAQQEILEANLAFPERPFEAGKAWREMVHRYLAGSLLLLVFTICWAAWRDRQVHRNVRYIATALLLLIVFQALLGMWTVTLKLKPIIVMAHLLGGMATFALLTWLVYANRRRFGYRPSMNIRRSRAPIIGAIMVLAMQIALGGWTSANYAALACPDVPQCTGQWWPDADFAEAFVLWREIGVDYEGGILDQPARAAIHVTHRIGAVVTLLVLISLGVRLRKVPRMRGGSSVLMALVVSQFTLGVLNVTLHLPLANAVAHNAGAALLLLTLLGLLDKTAARIN